MAQPFSKRGTWQPSLHNARWGDRSGFGRAGTQQIFPLEFHRQSGIARRRLRTQGTQRRRGSVLRACDRIGVVAPASLKRFLMCERDGVERIGQRVRPIIARLCRQHSCIAHCPKEILSTRRHVIPRTDGTMRCRVRGQHRALTFEVNAQAMQRIWQFTGVERLERVQFGAGIECTQLEPQCDVFGEGHRRHIVADSHRRSIAREPLGEWCHPRIEMTSKRRGNAMLPTFTPVRKPGPHHHRLRARIGGQSFRFRGQPIVLHVGIAGCVRRALQTRKRIE